MHDTPNITVLPSSAVDGQTREWGGECKQAVPRSGAPVSAFRPLWLRGHGNMKRRGPCVNKEQRLNTMEACLQTTPLTDTHTKGCNWEGGPRTDSCTQTHAVKEWACVQLAPVQMFDGCFTVCLHSCKQKWGKKIYIQTCVSQARFSRINFLNASHAFVQSKLKRLY